MRRPACLAVLAAALVATPAAAQAPRPESLARYGGRYAVDCRASASAQAVITAQALLVEQGDRHLRTANRQDSFVSFGAAPTSPVPEGYQLEFIGDDFSLYVFEDASGPYVPLAGYTDAAAKTVDARAMKAKLRRCGS